VSFTTYHTQLSRWLNSLSIIGRYSESLGLGRFGDRFPLGTRYSVLFQTYLNAQTILLYNGYWEFPGCKAAGVRCWGCELVGATHLLPAPPCRDCSAMLWRDFFYVHTYICMYACMCVCMCVCMYLRRYVCIYVLMYIPFQPYMCI